VKVKVKIKVLKRMDCNGAGKLLGLLGENRYWEIGDKLKK